MVDCVWLCCLTYVIVWMSRVKASFKCWSILITNLGKQSSFSPICLFFFMCLCKNCKLVISQFHYLFEYFTLIKFLSLGQGPRLPPPNAACVRSSSSKSVHLSLIFYTKTLRFCIIVTQNVLMRRCI